MARLINTRRHLLCVTRRSGHTRSASRNPASAAAPSASRIGVEKAITVQVGRIEQLLWTPPLRKYLEEPTESRRSLFLFSTAACSK